MCPLHHCEGHFMQGRKGQDGNGSAQGKLSRVPSCAQGQNVLFTLCIERRRQ